VSNSYNHQTFVGLFSAAAVLEIGPDPNVQSVDKVADLRSLRGPVPPAGTGKAGSAGVTATGVGLSVGAGSIDYQVINNTGSATSPTEPLPCRVLGGASRWLLFQPTNTATMRIDTMGSSIDTVLGVLTGSDPLSLVSFLCDDDSAPDGSRNAFVRFTATIGTRYYVQADGKSGTNGIICHEPGPAGRQRHAYVRCHRHASPNLLLAAWYPGHCGRHQRVADPQQCPGTPLRDLQCYGQQFHWRGH
jgi:hypothetical protein